MRNYCHESEKDIYKYPSFYDQNILTYDTLNVNDIRFSCQQNLESKFLVQKNTET